MLKPAVVDFIEFATQSGNVGLETEEILIKEESAIKSKTLTESGIGRELEVVIVAIKDRDGMLKLNSKHDLIISTGDTLIVIGEASKLEVLEEMAAC